MPYRYLEDVATADVAFEAWGETVEEMLTSAADATVNVMVDDLNSVKDRVRRTIRVEADAVDMILFEVLQELIYCKDAEKLLLRIRGARLTGRDDHLTLEAEAYGEELDPKRHELVVDVKAVTLHRFEVAETAEGWRAHVILDI